MARQDKHEATLREAGATPDHIRVHRRGCDVLELGLDLYVTFDGRPKDFPIGFSETDPEAWQPGDIALIFSGCGPGMPGQIVQIVVPAGAGPGSQFQVGY